MISEYGVIKRMKTCFLSRSKDDFRWKTPIVHSKVFADEVTMIDVLPRLFDHLLAALQPLLSKKTKTSNVEGLRLVSGMRRKSKDVNSGSTSKLCHLLSAMGTMAIDNEKNWLCLAACTLTGMRDKQLLEPFQALEVICPTIFSEADASIKVSRYVKKSIYDMYSRRPGAALDSIGPSLLEYRAAEYEARCESFTVCENTFNDRDKFEVRAAFLVACAITS